MTITVPDEVVEAGRTAWLESASDYTRLDVSIRAAIAAAISAWPGAKMQYKTLPTEVNVILPLSQQEGE